MIIEQTDQINQQRRAMQSKMLEKKRAAKVSNKVKNVPIYSQSSKLIMQEKKANVSIMKAMEASKEAKGKGGR